MCRGSFRARKSFTKLRMLSNWATSRCRGVTLLVPRCSLIASAALQSHAESLRSHVHVVQACELSGPVSNLCLACTANATTMHVAACVHTSVYLRHPAVGYITSQAAMQGCVSGPLKVFTPFSPSTRHVQNAMHAYAASWTVSVSLRAPCEVKYIRHEGLRMRNAKHTCDLSEGLSL